MSYQSILEDEFVRLQKLKLNIHLENLKRFVEEVKKQWIPKTKEVQGELIHGSSKGTEEKLTLYWDELRGVWSTESLAFQGHLLKKLKNKQKHYSTTNLFLWCNFF